MTDSPDSDREAMLDALRIGQKMRQRQAAYFKTRHPSHLIESKKLEKQFDEKVKALIGDEGNLPL